MSNSLADDVIVRIFKYLGLKERARMALLNKRFQRLTHKWEDVLCCSARLGGCTLAGDDFLIEIERPCAGLPSKGPFIPAVMRCPVIRKLAIHDDRLLYGTNVDALANMVNVDELHIPSSLFSVLGDTAAVNALLSLPKLRILCIQQRYNEVKSGRNMLHVYHVQKLTSKLLYSIDLQGVAVTPAAFEKLSSKYEKTLETLNCIGALVHTQDMDVYFDALNRFAKLTVLSLPPSLYSISSTNQRYFVPPIRYPSLRNLNLLRSLTVFVSRSDISELMKFVKEVLPPSTEQVILYGESWNLQAALQQQKEELPCQIQFCYDDDVILDRYWMHGSSELLTYTVWKPQALLIPTLPEWFAMISEVMDTAVNSEVTCRDVTPRSSLTSTENSHSIRSQNALSRQDTNEDIPQERQNGTAEVPRGSQFGADASRGDVLPISGARRTPSLQELTARDVSEETVTRNDQRTDGAPNRN